MWERLLAGPLGGRPVRRVVVTHYHPDHVGLAGWFQARGAELCDHAHLLAHGADAGARRCSPCRCPRRWPSGGRPGWRGTYWRSGWPNARSTSATSWRPCRSAIAGSPRATACGSAGATGTCGWATATRPNTPRSGAATARWSLAATSFCRRSRRTSASMPPNPRRTRWATGSRRASQARALRDRGAACPAGPQAALHRPAPRMRQLEENHEGALERLRPAPAPAPDRGRVLSGRCSCARSARGNTASRWSRRWRIACTSGTRASPRARAARGRRVALASRR
jgi:hypothetical protein